MTLVLNKNDDGFSLPYEFMKMPGCDFDSPFDWIERNDSRLVDWVKNNPDDCGYLTVVEIPDNATDYEINEYDGWEIVTYVVGGKLFHA